MSTIRIKSHLFHISDPYSVGHPLTAAEAQSLNGLRAENIGRAVRKGLPQDGGVLSDEEIDRLSALIQSYDQLYTFPLHPIGDGISTLDREVKAVAQEVAEETIRHDYPSLGDSEYEAAVARMAPRLWDDPQVGAEARRRLDVRQRVAKQALEELLS